MADTLTIEAAVRKEVGKGSARAARAAGLLPGVVYGGGKEPVSISIDRRIVLKELEKPGFTAKLFDLKIDGQTERAIPRDLQLHPVKDHPIHIDFMRVSKGSRLNVSVPLVFANEEQSPGIKRGGMLNAVLHELEVSCPATSIPEQFVIDLTGLEIHDTVHLANVELPNGVEAVHPERDDTIATIVAPSAVKSEAAEAAEAAAEAVEGEEVEAAAEGGEEEKPAEE